MNMCVGGHLVQESGAIYRPILTGKMVSIIFINKAVLKMEDEGLQLFYGIRNSPKLYHLKSFFFDEMISGINEDWSPAVKAVTSIWDDCEVYLFLSTLAERIWDRYKPFSEVVQKNYKISGEVAAEKNIAISPHRILRTGAIKVTNYPIQSVLQTLLEYHDSAFVALMPSGFLETAWICDLLSVWQKQSLETEFLSACVDAICVHQGIFMHLFNGCDGFSINCISLSAESTRDKLN